MLRPLNKLVLKILFSEEGHLLARCRNEKEKSGGLDIVILLQHVFLHILFTVVPLLGEAFSYYSSKE